MGKVKRKKEINKKRGGSEEREREREKEIIKNQICKYYRILKLFCKEDKISMFIMWR